MQDNSFDKNIDQQLHDIQLEPSPAVWDAVEKELDKKKRRYPFAWWLLPVLLTGGLLFWYLGPDHSGQETSTLTSKSADKKRSFTETGFTKNTPEPTVQATYSPIDSATLLLTKVNNKEPNDATVDLRVASSQAIKDEGKFSGSGKRQTGSGKTKLRVRSVEPVEGGHEKNLADGYTPPPQQREEVDPIAPVSSSDSREDPKTEVKQVEPVSQRSDSIEKTSSVALPKEEKSTLSSKWKKEWSVAGGRSLFGKFDLSDQQEDFLFDPTNTGASPSPGVNLIQRVEYRFAPGAQFDAGLQFRKPISTKFSFLTGLHYNYQMLEAQRKVSIDTVTIVGTSVSYTTISTSLYHERLRIHSIGIPLLIRFSPAKRFDISTGLYNNFMFST